jgi:NTP pyrophosphatase (non-canonical NTP hydrolase)
VDFPDLRQFQAEHRAWLEHNFPGQKPADGLLGMVEEVGELAHAHLKGEQGIRHTPEEIDEMKQDAIGDVFIYAASYCNTNGFDLAVCVRDAWDRVSKRDWIADPMAASQVESS